MKHFLIFLFLYPCLSFAVSAAPDYRLSSAWAALPSKANDSMWVPLSSLENRQSTAAADVFYIYPTYFYSDEQWNASIDDPDVNEQVSKQGLRTQAAIFNGVAKIYAPRYRQASVFVFVPPDEGGPLANESKAALDLAYHDIENAFDYYMMHYNRGRPFFIVAHSQGSYLAKRLIRDNEKKYPLNKLLIAAYIVGERLGDHEFKTIHLCKTPTAIHCYLGWTTVEEGRELQYVTGKARGKPVCVNPLTFDIKKPEADEQAQLGAMPKSANRIIPHLFSAECDDKGVLRITPFYRWGFPNEEGDYHESDYLLFFMNIRENAKARLRYT